MTLEPMAQSALTNWCPMMTFLMRAGVREHSGAAART